jgi:S1/P1 Nuclease
MNIGYYRKIFDFFDDTIPVFASYKLNSMKFQILALLALALCPLPAMAWNRAGHMVSGAIAYGDLQKSAPDKVRKVVALLKSHPEYRSRWLPELEKVPLTDAEKDQYLFSLAARWPDDIRGATGFDHPTWHYVNLPFTPGATFTPPSIDPNQESILTAFPKNLNILRSNASASERAIAFCWFEHLLGDVHQPLHTTKLITPDYPEPEGDRGGTRFYIKVRPDSGTISLHKFWDDAVIGSEKFRSVRNVAIEMRSRSGLQRASYPQLADTRFEDWAKNESFKLSREVAYRNGSLKGSKDKTNGTVLPPDYASSAKAVAERQLVLAGYRMADAIKKLF